MEDIAKRAKLSSGKLYLYFKNRDELYATLIFRILRFFILRLKQIDTGNDTEPSQMVNGLIETRYDVFKLDPAALISLYHLQSSESLQDISPQLKSDYKELYCESCEAIARIIGSVIKKKGLKEKNSAILTDIIWALFSGVALLVESKRLFGDGKHYMRQTLDIASEIFTRRSQLQER